jgi:TonB-linked SusC/RagA family outer membrane protein
MKRSFYRLLQPCLTVLILLCFGAVSLSAQRVVRGKVSDEFGGVPGATVVEKGTNNGTVTDVNGDFSLKLTGATPVIKISATGYAGVELDATTQNAFNVTLTANDNVLDEFIITGYTVDTRKQTTSAVATVKTRDLAAVPTGNVEQQLQGRVSGLTVISNGQPGTSSQVRIRGFGSFTNNQPLYVVDGVPTQNVSFLTPDDIENTTVMKDASSASIYGARAAGGVIVITTKHGTRKAQPLKVSYDALYGVTDPGQGQTMLTPQEQADWTWKAIKNGGGIPTSHKQYGSNPDRAVVPDYINVGGQGGLLESQVNLAEEQKKYNVNFDNGNIYQIVRANKEGTDWYGAITRNAPMTRHNLGFSGSTDHSRYYLGLSLQNQSGVLKYNDFKRNTIRANMEFDLGKHARVGQNFQFTHSQVLGLSGGGGGVNVAQDENDILSAFRMPSIIPIYDINGGYAGTAAPDFNNPRNPVAARDGLKDNRSNNYNAFGNVYAEYDLFEGLTLRTSLGGDYYNYSGFGYNRRSYENSENNGSYGYNEFYGNGINWVNTNTVQYKKQFGQSNLEVLAGQESLVAGAGRNMDASGLNPFSNDPDFITINTVSNATVRSNNNDAQSYSSVFGRAHYSFKDKYYVTGVVRRDGASVFGPNKKYGVFPGVSAAWRVSGEEFMKGMSWIDDLKIRGGWGQMGNSQIRPTNQYSLFASNINNSFYDINGTNNSAAPGFYQSTVGDPNVRWETSTTSNVGFEMLLLKGKWDLIVDLWQKKTSDLLFTVPQSDVAGQFAAAPFRNIAEMTNKGIDMQLVNKGRFTSKVGYELTLTGSFLKNNIDKITEGLDYFDAFPASNRLAGSMVRNQVGTSISAFFGYQVEGLFQTQAEIDALNAAAPVNANGDKIYQEGAAPGRFFFADLNGLDDKGNLTGKPDGKVDAADRTYIGSPVPKFTGGINFKVTVGAFDVETYIYTSYGNKIFNLSKWFTDFYPSFTGAAVSARVKESWSPENTGAELPIFETASNFSTNTQPNSFYVEDGSYIRMQNLSIGYNLPKSMMSKTKLSRARIYASTNNVITLTKYKGLDPSVGGAADTNFGIDVGNYPITRSVVVGLGVTF